jgi:uncharacterized YigZ family protein
MKMDEYRTIESLSKGVFKDRGSKFIAIAQNVNSTEDVKKKLAIIQKEYRDARHHCYAYRIGISNDNWRVNDDGEPSGTAGKPIMGQINSFGLTNILLVVIRYFGGTLLGTGGLINAYRNASKEALSKANIILKTINHTYLVDFPYKSINDVMKLIKDEGLEQSDQVFELNCSIKITFRKSMEAKVISRLGTMKDISYRNISDDLD